MDPKQRILATAFLEGLSVLIIEIAGARALAPFYGSSLTVWTAQITATLLFLALGYALGGRLSRAGKRLALPAVLWSAGAWLGLYPFVRSTVLAATAALPGIAPGSFLASALLFGPVLLGLGAVSPLLIQRIQSADRGGEAAGAVFFTNTLGGLAGGWLTALVLIPHAPLRLVLAATGLGLALLGSLWAWPEKKPAPAVGLPLLLLILLLSAPGPLRSFVHDGNEGRIVYARNSGIGLIQVLDLGHDGFSQALTLLIDGITQGGMLRADGQSAYEFSEYQARLSWRYHPQARRALLLGLGSGVLAKSLDARGIRVEAAEIEPQIERVARRYFQLPDAVTVHSMDARAFLRRSHEAWDLVFVDAFAGENAPWYLMTQEGLQSIREHLSPGGCVLINTVTDEAGDSPGLRRLEAGLRQVFGQGMVFVEAPDGARKTGLVNACVVAGADPLTAGSLPYPGHPAPWIAERSESLLSRGRPLRGALSDLTTDERSDMDLADAGLRQAWRRLVMGQMDPRMLGD